MKDTLKRRTLLKAVGSTSIAPLVAVGTMSLAGCSTDSGPSPTTGTATPEGTMEGDGEISVFHYNMEMGDKPDVVGVVIDQILERQPTVITFNELCLPDYNEIYGKIREKTPEYRGNFDHHARGSCFPDVQGVGVFLRHGDESTQETLDIGQKTVCISSHTEPSISACSTHLSAPPDGDTHAEVTALHEAMRTQAGDGPVVIAGDLNLDPWEQEVRDFYDDFHEIAQHDEDCGSKGNRPKGKAPPASCTYEHDTQGWKKIDYIFVDKEHFTSDVIAEVRPGRHCGENNTKPCSDHQQLWGAATLKQPDTTPSSSTDGLLKWSFRLDFSGDTECPDSSSKPNSILCIPPVWVGSYEVADDGTITGEEERVDLYLTNYCRMLDIDHSVTITGNSPDGGDTLDLSLEFDAPDIRVTEPSGPEDDCNAEEAKRRAQLYRDELPQGTVEIEGSFRRRIPVTFDGHPYRFESCVEGGSQINSPCLPSDLKDS